MATNLDFTPAHVRVHYDDPWRMDTAEEIICKPMVDEMFKACEAIAERYAAPNITITLV